MSEPASEAGPAPVAQSVVNTESEHVERPDSLVGGVLLSVFEVFEKELVRLFAARIGEFAIQIKRKVRSLVFPRYIAAGMLISLGLGGGSRRRNYFLEALSPTRRILRTFDFSA